MLLFFQIISFDGIYICITFLYLQFLTEME